MTKDSPALQSASPDITVVAQQAMKHHQEGRFAEAEQGYRAVLDNDPGHFHALRLLGALYLQQQRYAEAETLLHQALCLSPENPELLNNIGLVLHRHHRQPQQALDYFKQALHAKPDHIEAKTNYGNALRDLGSLDEVAALYGGDDACTLERMAVYVWLAAELFNQNRWDEALAIYTKILHVDAGNLDALLGIGNIFYKRGDVLEARRKYQAILDIHPHFVDARVNLGVSYWATNQFEEAITHLQSALKLTPNHIHARVELGSCYASLGMIEEAEAQYKEVLQREPAHALALGNMGVLCYDRADYQQTLEFYEKSLAIDPYQGHARFHKGLALLALGHYREGWPLYEVGLTGPGWRGLPLFKSKMWDGTAHPDKKLLIWGEQGLGDALQFVRYAPLCKQRFAKICVLCYPPLVDLLRNCPAIDFVCTTAQEGAFDHHISIMSLPHVFGTTLETIPAQVPYLYVGAAARAKWAGKVVDSGKFKVGLAWAGDARKHLPGAHMIDRRRSMNLAALRPLFDLPYVQFYNLQMGQPAAQIDECGWRDRFIDLMPEVKDFEDTAAIVEQLDLVIAVDTSIVHLAGGLGKAVWILSRFDACWRWLQNRETSPWYPTARVFGQPTAGDWASVVAKVRQELIKDSTKST